MSDNKNIIGLRLKCLELAVNTQTVVHPSGAVGLFPTLEIHQLAQKYERYIETGEWEYNQHGNGKEENREG